ncbi:MAG: oligoendopeptidase F [Saprospiraceae bacterium]|jgi:oligoendopeptidase F
MTENTTRKFIPTNFTMEWDSIKPLLESLLNRNIDSKEDFSSWLNDQSELFAALDEDFAWRYIKMTCDTTDEELRGAFNFYAENIEPHIAPYANKLNIKLSESEFFKNNDSKQLEISFRNVKGEIEIFRDENIPLFTKLQVKQQEYGALSGGMAIHHDGKEYTLQQASKFIKENDRDLRQTVFNKIAERRLNDKDALDALFNELISLRNKVAVNAGFKNFRDYKFKEMSRFDYNKEDCFKFHESVEKTIVPILKEIAKERRQALKLETLKPWDMAVDPSGKKPLKPFDGQNDLVDKTIKCFNRLDPALGDCIKSMKEKGLLDLESRKGKAPGGYNYPLSESNMPFIFMNSSNSLRDLTTMVHEGGHAVHTFLSAHLPLVSLKHCPSEVAELASMSMELMSMEHWDIFFSNAEDLKSAKIEQLEGVLETLPWVSTIDAFQHWIYENPTHTSKEREEKWLGLYDNFGHGFSNWEGLEKSKRNLWQKQLHLYEVPFYYIEYGFAQLGAIAVWKNYCEDPENTLKSYQHFLSLGNTKTIPELYKAAGVSFDFSKEYVGELANFVKMKLAELK